MREHDFEPVRGLPGELPEGETLLWQGSPRWTRLACEAFHIRAVATYLGLMLAWRAAGAIGAGTAPVEAARTALLVAPLMGLAVGALALLAWLVARTTVYTVTDRRIVLRFGIALTKAINLPFTVVESGALKPFSDGSGDVALTLKAPNKLAFLQIWPHARPWRVSAPQPTLRAVPEAASVARLIASTMKLDVAAAVLPAAPAAPGARVPPLGRPEPVPA